jgi:hypothetical protein
MVSVFPDADITPEIEMVRFGYDRHSALDSTTYAMPMPAGSSQQTESTDSRGSRAPPEIDLKLEMLEWDSVNDGWGNRFEVETSGDPPVPVPGLQYTYGGFQIGKTTRFTATITNLNPSLTASGVKVNFTFMDWYSGVPMDKRPITKEITVSGVTTEVTYDFVTPFAGRVYASAVIDYEGDPDISNNGVGWFGMPVFIWSADLETGGSDTGWGWQKLTDGSTVNTNSESEWTGDINNIPTAQDIWHITSTPQNGNSNEHTASRTWYHGQDVIALNADIYDDTINRNIGQFGRNHTFLETPKFDMGDIDDTGGQDTLGELQENYFYSVYLPMFASMATGEYETFTDQGTIYLDESDFTMMREYADNTAGDNWRNHGVAGYGFVYGQFEQIFVDQTTPHWNPVFCTVGQNLYYGYPFRVFLGDGSGGVQDFGGAKNWSKVRFRGDYTGDGEDDQTGEPGAYFDDFAAWGMQDYVVENRLGFTELTYPLTNGVSILYDGSAASFTAKVKNWGKSKQANIKVDIYEIINGQVSTSAEFTQQKSGGTLGTDQESSDIVFSWPSPKEGDYKLVAVVGDPNTDWTPTDNEVEFILHVGPADTVDVDVLLVDDDNSIGGPNTQLRGSNTGIWYINTEFKMMDALIANDMKFRVYTVGYNESGPTVDIMDEYECIIWMTGLDNEYTVHAWRQNYDYNKKVWDVTLKQDDLDQLELFLSNPNKVNKLWLISPGFLYDKYGGGSDIPAGNDFAKVYLKIDRLQANDTEWNNDFTAITVQGTPNPLVGVTDSVMDSVQYETYEMPDPPYRFNDIGGWVDKAPGDKDTSRLFYQDDAHYNYNSLQYKDKNMMSAYFAFNFYLLGDKDERKDCAYRVLTGFGMTGGVIVKPYQNVNIKDIMPGQEISFRFTVENTGKRDDTMTLSVTKNSKYSDWVAWFEINGVKKNNIQIAGLGTYNKVYLYVQAPDFEDSDDYSDDRNIAGTYVPFTIRAVSQLTSLDNSTRVFAQIGAVGNITLTCDDPNKIIDAQDTAEFPLKLMNETNGIDDVDVRLSFKGAGNKLAQFVVNNQQKNTPEVLVTLEPNRENFDVKLQVTAEEHTITGYHNVTVEVKDEENTVLDSVDLSIRVNQFYQVMATTDGDLDEGEVNFTIDPNNYTSEDIDYIKKSFIVNVLNFGNGIDVIELDFEENDESADTSDWFFGIKSPDDPDAEDNVTSIAVDHYDVTNIPKYGEEEIQFDIYIPIDVDEGTYIVDFFIESSDMEEFNPGVDEDENNRVSFKFKIIKPNLRFIPQQTDTGVDNFEFWDWTDNIRIQRDYLMNDEFYLEKKHSAFTDLSIEFKVAIDNIGADEIDLDPSNIWLNITHKDEFGDTIYDANLTPTHPTSSKKLGISEDDHNETFTFMWEFIDQDQNEIIDYSFTVTIDPYKKIYETDEDDNSNSVQLTIKHLKKPKKSKKGSPGFEGVIMLAAIIIVVVALAGYRQASKRKD